MRLSKNNLILFSIILIGFILRVWGLGFGLPFQFHQDEPIVVNHALAYGSGDLNPHFFIIPPLCSYLLFIFYGIYFVLGKLFGVFAGANDFALNFFSDPTTFYLIARVVLGAIPGTLAIWLSYTLYKKLFGKEGSLYAAAIVAFSFLTVINAHYAYTDNIMLVLILATYIFLIKMVEIPSFKNYLISAMFIGLAIGVKYNAAILLASAYTAHAIVILSNKSDKKRLILDKRLWCAAGVVVLMFIIVNPFSILDRRFFLDSVFGKIRNNYMGWSHHITYSLAQGLGLSLAIGGLIGVTVLAVRVNWKKSILFLSFPILFYLHLVFKSQRFSRYGLPLVPFLAIGLAFLIFKILFPKAKNSLSKIIVCVIAIGLLVPTTMKAIKADMLFSGDDTRILSTEWIESNIPQNTKIAVDHTSFRPQISQSREQILQKYDIAGFQEGLGEAKKKKLDLLLKVADNKKTYNVYFITTKPEDGGQFLSTMPAIGYNIDEMKGNGIEYVVVNYNTFSDSKENFLMELDKRADIVAAFSPYRDDGIKARYDSIDATYSPIADKELFSRRRMGPAIVIYKLRKDR